MVEKVPVYHHFFTKTNLSQKSEIFNSFFAKQCSLTDNGSTLRSLFPLIKDKWLSDIDFLVDDIKNIISKFDSNKAHGDHMISIRMLKLCDKSICKPLNIIFKSCLTQDISPLEWKKANVAPIHKTKVLEGIIYNTMFTYFIQNKLISENQSRFKPCDSCVNQLLATAH